MFTGFVILLVFDYLLCSCKQIVCWGERSESLRSLQRCNFVCMSVCLYAWYVHHDISILNLMILYQLLREFLRMSNELREDTETLEATGMPATCLRQVGVAQMGTF